MTDATQTLDGQDQPKKKRVINVLAIDGGGIRGIIAARILEELEAKTGKPIAEQFDLIAGTSTGGILALGLTKPDPDDPTKPQFTAKEIGDLYREEGGDIFPKKFLGGVRALFQERYNAGGLEKALEERFGDAELHDALTNVLVTGYDIERRKTVAFKNRTQGELARKENFLMKDVARATSAAPTFFEPAKIQSIPLDDPQGKEPVGSSEFNVVDGGVYANNPARMAKTEADKIAQVYRARGEEVEVRVLSLGTGDTTEPILYDDAKDWGAVGWIHPANKTPIINIMMDGQADAVDYDLEIDMEDLYTRIEEKLTPEDASLAMDDASPKNIERLRAFSEKVVEKNRSTIDRIAAELKGDDPAGPMPANEHEHEHERTNVIGDTVPIPRPPKRRGQMRMGGLS